MAKASDVIDIEQDEPVTETPEAPSTGTGHKDFLRDAIDAAGDAASEADDGADAGEADEDAYERVAAQEEVTADDLREIAGKDGEGLTDEQLLAEYEKAEGTETFKLPFPIYDADGNKLERIDQLSAIDLLTGKVQLGYNALGKEQRKTLTEALRTAANGHYNESKMAQIMAERTQIYDTLQQLRKEHEAWGGDRQVWLRVLQAASSGNVEPLKQLIAAYSAEAGKLPTGAPADAGRDDVALESAGRQFIDSTITPYAYKLAQEYGANPQEVQRAILDLIEQEPAEFLSREKIDAIMNYEVVALLEQNGYTRGESLAPSAPADSLATEVAALKKQIQELTAGQANAATQATRNRARKTPPSGGGSTPGAGEAMPNLKSREDMKRYLRGETDD